MILGEDIRQRECDTNRPFVLISYSHANEELVREVFVELWDRGYNLWLDRAKLAHAEYSWTRNVKGALSNENCRLVIFFRSEASVASESCREELLTALRRKLRCAVVDVWKQKGMSAGAFYENLLADTGENRSAEQKEETVKGVYRLISSECNAVRFEQDCQSDSRILSGKLEEVLTEYDISPQEHPAGLPKRDLVRNGRVKLEWLADDWFGGYEVLDEADEHAGYFPVLAFREYQTTQGGSLVVVFVKDDFIDVDGGAEGVATLALVCKLKSGPEQEQAEPDAGTIQAIGKHISYMLGHRNYGDGYGGLAALMDEDEVYEFDVIARMEPDQALWMERRSVP